MEVNVVKYQVNFKTISTIQKRTKIEHLLTIYTSFSKYKIYQTRNFIEYHYNSNIIIINKEDIIFINKNESDKILFEEYGLLSKLK